MDLTQSCVIDATWEPLFVDEVNGHILRKAEYAKILSHLKSPIGTKLGLQIHYETLCMLM